MVCWYSSWTSHPLLYLEAPWYISSGLGYNLLCSHQWAAYKHNVQQATSRWQMTRTNNMKILHHNTVTMGDVRVRMPAWIFWFFSPITHCVLQPPWQLWTWVVQFPPYILGNKIVEFWGIWWQPSKWQDWSAALSCSSWVSHLRSFISCLPFQ